MLMKRIFSTLLITGVIAISAAATHAQSTGRKVWARGASVNNPIPAMSDRAIESAPVAELQVRPQESKKTALVGSWLITTLDTGNRVVASYTSDGIAIGSSQGDVSLAPDFPTSTPQHGAWKYVGGGQFAVTLLAVEYDVPTAESRGMIKIILLLTLNETGDQFSGTAKVEIFDVDGNMVDTFSFPIQGTRIKVEPFN
jgi:hypothetical protein